MATVQEQQNTSFNELKDRFNFTNPFEAPRLVKIVVSTGIGSVKEKGKIEIIKDRIARITGQEPAPRPAKKSIASFKMREGDIVGYQVTLRGKAMYGFLDKLIHIALPRTKDFRGLVRTAVDEMGNYTLGIREHTIFPETADEELKDVFGFSVTIVTTAKNREVAEAYLEHLGLPFKRTEEEAAS